mgnify:CR=1 FL=1
METRASYVLVGSFVLGLVAAAVIFVLWIGGGTATNKFTLRVQAVNDAPGFVLATNTVVVPNSNLTTIPNFATNISKGPPDEIRQLLTFILTTNAGNFF